MNICEATIKSLEREQTTIRLPAELKERIQKEADNKGISFNAMMIILIEQGLEY